MHRWFIACWLLVGCSDGRTAVSATERYACLTQGDCLAGFVCTCGLCQPVAGPVVCAASAGDADGNNSGTDAGATDSAGGAPDAGSLDAGGPDAGNPDTGADTAVDSGPITCGLIDWSNCPDGQSCEWNAKAQQTSCVVHGQLGYLAKPCDPAAHQCGTAVIDGQVRPLRCDVIDKTCYPTCNWQTEQPGCPAGLNCWKLADNDGTDWPQHAGICAPM